MRVAVFGAGGMLGKAILRRLSVTPEITAFGYARNTGKVSFSSIATSLQAELLMLPSLTDSYGLGESLAALNPDVIVNCIGHRGTEPGADKVADMVLANSWWPHQLAALADATNARLIHFSSDGVFSGRQGRYREDDIPDAEDLYGRSKLLGEPVGAHCLTIRTSIIGHDHFESVQLLDWLLRQQGSVCGYSNVIFSGLTTVEISKIVADILLHRSDMSGVWNIASQPISKYDLLAIVIDQYRLGIDLMPAPQPVCDRSLDGSRFSASTGYIPPTWPDLIANLWHSLNETQKVRQ